MAKVAFAPEDCLMTADVARIFEVSERKVYDWINGGTLVPAGRIGRLYYFSVKDVQEACRANTFR